MIAEEPKAGTIVKTEEGPFGYTVLTLSKGVRVILKTTDFKADEIRMRAFSPGGNSLFPDNEILQIKVLNDVAGLGGLGNFSNVDLEKVLAGKKASISTAVNGLSEGMNGSCSPKDLETLLQLVYLSFTLHVWIKMHLNHTKAALKPHLPIRKPIHKSHCLTHCRKQCI